MLTTMVADSKLNSLLNLLLMDEIRFKQKTALRKLGNNSGIGMYADKDN